MLVIFVLRVLVKIGIELSSSVIGGLMLIVLGCIIYAIVGVIYEWIRTKNTQVVKDVLHSKKSKPTS